MKLEDIGRMAADYAGFVTDDARDAAADRYDELTDAYKRGIAEFCAGLCKEPIDEVLSIVFDIANGKIRTTA